MNDNNQKQSIIYPSDSFFLWGFIIASNGVFIPFCKKYFSLGQFQSQLIEFAFYGILCRCFVFIRIFYISNKKIF